MWPTPSSTHIILSPIGDRWRDNDVVLSENHSQITFMSLRPRPFTDIAINQSFINYTNPNACRPTATSHTLMQAYFGGMLGKTPNVMVLAGRVKTVGAGGGSIHLYEIDGTLRRW